MLVTQAQGLSSSARFQDRIALFLQDVAGQPAHAFFVLNEKYCFLSLGRLRQSLNGWIILTGRLFQAAQKDLEAGALAWLAIDPDVPFALFDNAENRGESQTGAA